MSVRYVKVAEVHEVEPGQMVSVYVGTQAILLANVGGTFYAIDNECSHDRGDLAGGDLIGSTVECPRHGSAFDLSTGAVLSPPAPAGVRTYPVRRIGDALEVGLAE